MPSSSPNNNRRHRRRNYTSVANQDVDEGGDDFHDEPNTQEATDNVNTNECNSNDSEMEMEEDCDNEEDLPMSITILDSAQKKFPIPCDKHWTVGKFKRMSAKIHKVAPAQQRLIFRGKMLTKDDQTLEDNKLDANDLIVHLFPKPRVVVTASKKDTDNTADGTHGNSRSNNRDANDDGDTGIVDEDHHGAHIPSIVIDQDEQDRRGQILVLGSVEIAESQNNVKMLSLLLVMICAMRLLTLFGILMGADVEDSNMNSPYGTDAVHNHTGDSPHNRIYDSDFQDDNVLGSGEDVDYVVRTWQTQDYFELLVSAIGFYVGTLGMKATQENTFKLATAYAMGTIVAGIGWNLWNVYAYIRFFEEEEERQMHDGYSNATSDSDKNEADWNNGERPPYTRDDYIAAAFLTILMPLFVWFLCCARAFEFRRLIGEAEEEAADRIRNEYVVNDGTATDGEEGANATTDTTPIISGGTNHEIV